MNHDALVECFTHVLRGNLIAGGGDEARQQRDADIAILETMKGDGSWSTTLAATSSSHMAVMVTAIAALSYGDGPLSGSL